MDLQHGKYFDCDQTIRGDGGHVDHFISPPCRAVSLETPVRTTRAGHRAVYLALHHISRIRGRLACFFRFSSFAITRRLSIVLLPPFGKGQL